MGKPCATSPINDGLIQPIAKEPEATNLGSSNTRSPKDPAKKTKREICHRCHRPTPRACICEALPDQPLTLNKCQVLVLQHPHEARRKNRSVPLCELCLDCTSLKIAVARRFGDQVDSEIMKLLSEDNVLLVYPSPDAVSIKEALECIKKRQSSLDKQLLRNRNNQQGKITIVLLDATWKYAREMERANVLHKQYPQGLIRVKIQPSDNSQDSDNLQGRPMSYQPRRFDIRTPPSDDHLSTAECIAWVTSLLEDDLSLYARLMKPLDLMVEKWRSFTDRDSANRKRRTFKDGDGLHDDGQPCYKK